MDNDEVDILGELLDYGGGDDFDLDLPPEVPASSTVRKVEVAKHLLVKKRTPSPPPPPKAPVKLRMPALPKDVVKNLAQKEKARLEGSELEEPKKSVEEEVQKPLDVTERKKILDKVWSGGAANLVPKFTNGNGVEGGRKEVKVIEKSKVDRDKIMQEEKTQMIKVLEKRRLEQAEKEQKKKGEEEKLKKERERKEEEAKAKRRERAEKEKKEKEAKRKAMEEKKKLEEEAKRRAEEKKKEEKEAKRREKEEKKKEEELKKAQAKEEKASKKINKENAEKKKKKKTPKESSGLDTSTGIQPEAGSSAPTEPTLVDPQVPARGRPKKTPKRKPSPNPTCEDPQDETAQQQPPAKKKKSYSQKKQVPLAAGKSLELEDDEFLVEAIHGKRYNKGKRRWEYLIKWDGYGIDDNTWEPLENLESCPDLVREYNQKAKLNETKTRILGGHSKQFAGERYPRGPPPVDSDDEGTAGLMIKKLALDAKRDRYEKYRYGDNFRRTWCPTEVPTEVLGSGIKDGTLFHEVAIKTEEPGKVITRVVMDNLARAKFPSLLIDFYESCSVTFINTKTDQEKIEMIARQQALSNYRKNLVPIDGRQLFKDMMGDNQPELGERPVLLSRVANPATDDVKDDSLDKFGLPAVHETGSEDDEEEEEEEKMPKKERKSDEPQ